VGISYPATFAGYWEADAEALASVRKVPAISVHMEGLFWVFDCSYRQGAGSKRGYLGDLELPG
jgi:hypothetical protein